MPRTDAGFKLRENFRRKFSYESKNPRMDFLFDSHYGSRRVPATHIVCYASTPPAFASGGIHAASSSRWSALIPGFDSKHDGFYVP